MINHRYKDYLSVIFTGWLYAISYFFRGSIAPITDVLEYEFNATSSEIGLMSSLFWLTYSLVQLPIGLLLQSIQAETILIISSFLFSISTGLFGIITNINSIILPAIFMLLSGIFGAPFFLCFAQIVSNKFSNNHLAFYGGIMYALNAIILVSGNIIQANLYQNYQIWRPIYWFITILSIIPCISAFLTNYCHNRCNKNEPQGQEISKFSLKTIETALDVEQDLYEETEFEETDYNEALPLLHSKKHSSICGKIKLSLSNKYNWLISIHQFCVNTIQLAFNGLWLINYMSLKYGINRTVSTIISSTFWAFYAFGNLGIGKLAKKYKKRKIFYIIASFMIFLPPIYIIYGNDDIPLSIIIICNILSGIGSGVVSITFVLVREYNEYYECSDIASGLVNSISVSAGFFMPWLIGILMDISLDLNDTEETMYTVDNYNFAFMVIPIVGCIGIILSFVIRETNGNSIGT